MSNKIIQLGNIREDSKNFKNPQTGRVYSAEGIAPTIMSNSHGKTSGDIQEQKY